MTMESLHITGNRQDPNVTFDPANGVFHIVGVSIPEHASEFYAPVLRWLQEAGHTIPDGSTIHCSLSYFNSSSLKALYLVLMEVQKLIDAGKRIAVNWYVEEDDEFMAEAAETFTEMVGIELNIINGKLAA